VWETQLLSAGTAAAAAMKNILTQDKLSSRKLGKFV
jgi:hypothetical protein